VQQKAWGKAALYRERLAQESGNHFKYLGDQGMWVKANAFARGTIDPNDLGGSMDDADADEE
jgi:hypothetical protein